MEVAMERSNTPAEATLRYLQDLSESEGHEGE